MRGTVFMGDGDGGLPWPRAGRAVPRLEMLDRTVAPARVRGAGSRRGWTDHPIRRRRNVDPRRAHFEELRARIAALRAREGLPTPLQVDRHGSVLGDGERRVQS